MIRSLSEHASFSWIYNTYKYILAVETNDTLVATQNRIFFERLIKWFDTLFDYTFQGGKALNLLKINIIQSEHGISIYQTDHIIKNIIQ